MALSLTDPAGWKRLGGWLSFGLWNPDKGRQHSRIPWAGATNSNAVVSDERALQVSAVFSCIRILSETVGSLPLVVYERLDNDTRKVAKDHWLSRLLDEPNPLMTGQEYREALTASLATWGNGYSEIARNSQGRPVHLWPLRSEGMSVEKPEVDQILYRYHPSGTPSGEIKYQQNELLHVKGFGTDGIVGLAPLGMARQALGLAVSAEDYAGSFYANGGRPSGVMMADKLLNEKQREAIQKNFGGMAESRAADGNRLWVLEAHLKYQAISIPPEDAQMLQTRQFQISEIARFFRVPLFLLMEMEKSTSWGSGLEQQNLAFLAYTLRPYLTRIEKAINRWVLPANERGRFYVEHNVEALLRTDSLARSQFLATMVQNGLMTRNEGRSKENLPPMPGGDDLTVQVNLTPADQLNKITPKAPNSGAA